MVDQGLYHRIYVDLRRDHNDILGNQVYYNIDNDFIYHVGSEYDNVFHYHIDNSYYNYDYDYYYNPYYNYGEFRDLSLYSLTTSL